VLFPILLSVYFCALLITSYVRILCVANLIGSTRPLAHPMLDKAAGNSVFEDEMADYKVEDTPLEFSRATSLSSLSIDDEPRDVKVHISICFHLYLTSTISLNK